jgi:hypothetical protein
MKYMVCWSIPPKNYSAAVDAFLEGGAPMPEGLVSLGRWHAPGSTKGWLLCETDDPVSLAQHIAEWAHLLNLDVTPVIGDKDAAQAAASIRA